MDLEVASLVSVEGQVPQGSTEPLYGSVRIKDGTLTPAILKFSTERNRVPGQGPINEWVATALAKDTHVNSPDGYLLEVSTEMISFVQERFGVLITSPFGFASKILTIDPISIPGGLSSFSPDSLARLMAFDLLFLNSDRTRENPNCGKLDGELLAYDFGAAFVMAGLSARNIEKQYFPPGITDHVTSHLCRQLVSSQSLMSDIVDQMLTRISPCLDQVADFSGNSDPVMGSFLDRIKSFLLFLNQNRDLVSAEIVKII